MRYRISREDKIVEVSETWFAFAAANGVPGLVPDHVLGQPLWRFISGAQVRHLYELLLSRVRQTRGRLVLPFRCDAPELRRFMELTMTALSDGTVDCATRLVRAEPRDAVALLAPGGDPAQPALTICSWCKRVSLEQAGWVEVEEAVAQLGLLQCDTHPRLTHGVCPTCSVGVLRALSDRPDEALGGEPGEGAPRT